MAAAAEQSEEAQAVDTSAGEAEAEKRRFRSFSGSVNAVMAELPADDIRAVEIVAALADLPGHEYAEGRLRDVTLNLEAGTRDPKLEWIRRVHALYDLEAVADSRHRKIDGELMIVGLAEIDAELRGMLKDDGVLDILRIGIEVQPRPERPTLQMLADRPLEDDNQDRLGFDAYADAIAELIINEETVTPLTMAISAPWGAGKTSLANLVALRIRQSAAEAARVPHIVMWFNAWAHEKAPHLGAAFASEVAKQANRRRQKVVRLLNPLPASMLNRKERSRRRLRTVLTSFVAAVVLFYLVRDTDVVTDITGAIDENRDWWVPDAAGVVGLFTAALSAFGGIFSILFGTAKTAGAFVDSPEATASTGSMNQVRNQLGDLIRQATRKRWFGGRPRFVIFVDDLERCHPLRAVELCEAASQLLNHPNVVTVLIADMPAVAAAAEVKYDDLRKKYAARSGLPQDETGADTYGRLFLQKVVHFQFDLPTPRADETLDLTKELVAPTIGQADGAAVPWGRRLLDFVKSLPDFGKRLTSSPRAIVGWMAAGLLALVGLIGTFFGWAITPLFFFAAIAIGGVITLSTLGIASARKSLRSLEEAARNEAKEGASAAELQELITKKADELGLSKEVATRMHRRLIATDSALRAQAEEFIIRFLPPLPRSAKRMLNRLRFLLVVAFERNMFGGDPPLDASHLGKWVVLTERWPELSWAVNARPELIGKLESAAATATNIAPVEKVLEEAEAATRATPGLIAFLIEEPLLGPLAERLVHFEEANTTGSPAAGVAAE